MEIFGSDGNDGKRCAMTAVVCAKSVSVLFKLDKALTLYLRENKTAKRPVAVKPVEEDEELFGI